MFLFAASKAKDAGTGGDTLVSHTRLYRLSLTNPENTSAGNSYVDVQPARPGRLHCSAAPAPTAAHLAAMPRHVAERLPGAMWRYTTCQSSEGSGLLLLL